jgi:serine/threonine-protein kinase CTR1
MDLADSSLFDLLHNSRLDRFTLHQRLSMCHQVAKGLLYLHQMTPPVIHRDIKSHNVLVFNDNNSDDDIVLKLCDFGLVRTKTTAAGTPNYMAPELFRQASFSAAVDVYAFAVLACEIFTQQLPYRGYDPSDIARGEQ